MSDLRVTRRRLVTTAAAFLVVAGAVEASGRLGGGLAGTPVRAPLVTGSATRSKPSAGNTGVPQGTDLAVHDGDLLVSADGTLIEGLDIRGVVIIQASDVTIRNCVVRGPVAAPTSGSHALVQQSDPAHTNLLVEDCTLAVQTPNRWTVGVQGCNYTLLRCDISGGVDGADSSGVGNVLVSSCFIHGGAYFTPSTTNSDNQTHSDGAQVSSGSNIVYSNNTITGYEMSCFMVGQDQGQITGLKLLSNWLDGGAAMINLSSKAYPTLSVVIRDNKFGRSRPGTYQILAYGADTSKISNNVWEDNGQPVQVLGP